MFSFFSLQSPDDIKNMFNAELRFYNAVLTNAVDVAFRVADLNFYMWKQAAENWSEKSAKSGLADARTAPESLDANHFKKYLDDFETYGLQVTKIMQDLQAGLAKIER